MKACKGNYRVDYFEGCGTTANSSRKYGLCPSCLYKWSKRTKEGSEWYEKGLIKSRKKIETNNKKEVSKKKVESMPKTEYWSKKVQPIFNEIARIIDYGKPCIATNSFEGQKHGGHYISVGSNRTISLNLHNIHLQSAHSNKWKSGDDKRYREGLINRYGIDYLEFMEGLKKCPTLNLSKEELVVIRRNAMDIRIELRKIKKVLSPVESIVLRNEVNKSFGIYPKEFSLFIFR